jgi:hypothetical protein
MTTKVRGTLVVAFATIFMPGEALAATCTVPGSHPTIQAAVNDGSCSTINVGPGVYPENVMIPRSLTLNGAQAGNPVAGRTFFGPGESTITGTGANAPDITIQAAGVTIDGFSLTNPSQLFGILVKTAGNDAVIVNNIIQGIGALTLAPNPAAIYLERGPDGVSIVGNRIANVQSAPTAQGILVGDSTSPNASLNILIEENSIEDITSGTRGAYGIQINNGASTLATATGFTTVAILGNTITRLTGGGWAHAIGLEGDTPDVVVEGNSISAVVDLTPVVDMQDAIAVFFEANPSFGTARVNQNNFDVTPAAYGIAVHPALIAALPNDIVDGTCNWWGDASGPGPVGPGLGARVTTNVDFTPWLTAPAPGGPCAGGSTPGKATGGGQIEGEDPVFSLTDSVFFPIGTLLSIPALVPSASDPGSRASFGFVAKCCAASGNLQYNDHAADVQIKARSVDGLSITPATACPAPGGGRHATITGMADVIRSTVTTMEPFTVEVDDCGEPGTADTFGIETTSYMNTPKTLIGGNIQIRE